MALRSKKRVREQLRAEQLAWDIGPSALRDEEDEYAYRPAEPVRDSLEPMMLSDVAFVRR